MNTTRTNTDVFLVRRSVTAWAVAVTAVLLAPAALAETDDHAGYPDVDAAITVARQGRMNEAMTALAEAAKKHPELAPPEVLLAHVCFIDGRAAEGRRLLEVAAVRHGSDPEPFIMLADIAMREGRLAEADLLFSRGFDLCAGYKANAKRQKQMKISSLAGLAMADEERGLWNDAEQHLRAWIEVDGKQSEAWRRLATSFFFQERYDAARLTLQRLTSFDKNQPHADVSMGLLYEKTGQRDKARESFATAVEKSPMDLTTRLATAAWALNASETELANVNVVEALKLNDQSIPARLIQGMLARFDRDAAAAEKIFRDVHDRSPANFDATNQLVLSLLDQPGTDKHRQALEMALVNVRANPDLRQVAGREAAAALAWAMFRLEKYDDAERMIRGVMQAGEFSPDAAWYAAKIYFQRGDSEFASKLLQGALKSKRAFAGRGQAEELLKRVADVRSANDAARLLNGQAR